MFHTIALMLAVVMVCLVSPASGQTLLDSSFNGTGKVMTQYMDYSSKAYDAILQDDGKLIVVGSAHINPVFSGDFQVTLMRYNTNGTLDTSFDTDGKVATTTQDGSGKALGVALQTDSKIVVAGTYGDGGSSFVHRYNPNGSLDTTFDGDGIKILNFGSQNSGIAGDVVIQTDGKMVVPVAFGANIIVTRLNPDGSTDTGYGTGGKTVFNVFDTTFNFPPKVVLEPDGKVLVSAPSYDNPLVELNSDGTFNTGFGTGGRINGAGGNEVVRQPDGKILTVNTYSVTVHTVVRRYNADGSVDSSFGTNGIASVRFADQHESYGEETDLVLQPDGKIIIGTSLSIYPPTGSLSEFGLARLNANGTPDLFFGSAGTVLTNIQGNDRAYSVLVQADGKIVLTGYSDGGFTVVRYVPGAVNNACRPVADFDLDGKSDLAYFNTTGDWQYVKSSGGGGGTINWGLAGDKLVPGDYNGDCRTDLGIYRNGIWYIKTISGITSYYQFGLADDIPVPGDYDGDDRTDPAVYRDGMWYIMGTRDGFSAVNFGLATDKPVPGDYDGDGKEDIAVYRNGTWYLWQSNLGFAVVNFGLADDKPVVGDYDGDGKTDIAVFRPSDGMWYLLRSTLGFQVVNWGLSTDLPVPADFDGDGKTDIAIYRDGDWYLLQGVAGFQLKQWGGPTLRPIQNAFIR